MLSRTTPICLTCMDGKTMDWSIVREKLSDFARVDCVPTKIISVLLLLSLRKFYDNQILISVKQLHRKSGGKAEVGMETGVKLGIVSIAVEMNMVRPKNMSKGQ